MKLIIFSILVIWSHSTLGDPEAPSVECPRECTCEPAALRAAPFVLTWMTSWGEDDLPNVHPNEVYDGGMIASSETATDANVNVEVVGLHVTCSLHPTTNITSLLISLPSTTMVLSILQAPGCNLTIVDGGQLVGLSSLRALHLQGYAHVQQKQVSGFTPNSVPELIAHKKLLAQEMKESNEEVRELRLALAEDALHPLKGLLLLDLQYVRLVASKDARRSRRYSKEPLDSTTLLDMPLAQFLNLADKIDSFQLPPHLQHFYQAKQSDSLLKKVENAMDNQIETTGERYKIQRKFYAEGDDQNQETLSLKHNVDPKQEENKLHLKHSDRSSIVPYEIYKAEMQPELAPFRSLKELKYLRVAHARLDRVGPELLDGLHQLHTLTLEYNKIKILPDGMFTPTPNIRHLSLAHNNVLLLEASSLQGLTRLLTLDLDYNQVSVLGPASFPPLPSLKTLRLNENPVTHLLPDAFTSLNSTEKIFLGSYNVSMDVHENSFRFLYNLNSLELNNISMESLQKTLLTGMPGVEHLTIHGKIPEIDYDAFSTTPSLKSLNISFCHLSFLSVDALFGLNFLKKLDLSNNELTAVSPGTFDHLTNLRELYLHHNLLTTLPLGIFTPIEPKLIQLHYNPWECTCDLLQLRPSITNKVKRFGQVVCHWDEKLATVCTKTVDRLVYDTRVAPLCHEPVELFGNDIYHAALRHLKCSKYHWDPRLLLEEKQKSNPQRIGKVTIKKVKKNSKKDFDEEYNPKWLPLTAYTPEPIDTEDLLEIAEKEGLEEVPEENEETVENKVAMVAVENKVNIPQNDQPRIENIIVEDKPVIKDTEIGVQKAKLKLLVKAKALMRKEAKKRHMMDMFKKRQNEKVNLKAIIAAKQVEIRKQQDETDNNINEYYKGNAIQK